MSTLPHPLIGDLAIREQGGYRGDGRVVVPRLVFYLFVRVYVSLACSFIC